jgi:hypothetical protein
VKVMDKVKTLGALVGDIESETAGTGACLV